MYVHIHRQPEHARKSVIKIILTEINNQKELYEMHLSLGSHLDDIDTLESSDPAWGLLISIVSQT